MARGQMTLYVVPASHPCAAVECALRHPEALASYSEGADLPIPASLAVRSGPVLARLERALNRSTDKAVAADLAALDGHLDRADGYVRESVIGGEGANVADLQIAS